MSMTVNHIIAPAPQDPVPAPAPPPLLDLDFPPLSLQPHIPADEDEDDEYGSHTPAPPMGGLPMPPAATEPATAGTTSTPSSTGPFAALVAQMPDLRIIHHEPPPNTAATHELADYMQHMDAMHNAAERDLDLIIGR